MNDTLRHLLNEATERQDRAEDMKRQRKAEVFKEAAQQYLGSEVLASFDDVTFGYDMAGSFLRFRAGGHAFEIRHGPMSVDVLITLSEDRLSGKQTLLFANLKEEGGKDRILRAIQKTLATAEQQPQRALEHKEQQLRDGGLRVVIAPDLMYTFPDADAVNQGLRLLKHIAERVRVSS